MNYLMFTKMAVLCTVVICACQKQENWSIRGLNEHLHVNVYIDTTGQLTYALTAINNGNNYDILQPSPMGFITKDKDYSRNIVSVTPMKKKKGKEEFSMLHGKSSKISEDYTESSFQLTYSEGETILLTFRIFNYGVAYRYTLKKSNAQPVPIIRECSGFQIPESAKAWISPYDKVTKWTPGYELPYLQDFPAWTSSPDKEGWSFPALFYNDGYWTLITEAHLSRFYPACHLQPETDKGLFQIRYPEPEEAGGNGDHFPLWEHILETPWRLIIASRDLNDIVSSQLVHALSPPLLIENTNWILPGKFSWSWWSDHDSPQYPDRIKPFIDLASEMGWEYTLIDANWNEMPADSLISLIDYADKKNIKVWLWYNSGGPHNEVEEAPRDKMHLRKTRRETFQQLKEWGIAGVKIDFFQSDKVYIIRQYIDILEDAAEYKLMLNFHGCTLPRGWQRTYPHLLTMEAVRGAETYSFNADFPGIAASHHTVLPFTRNVTGSMDYTPLTFSDHRYPRLTTNAHELALSVLFESAGQHFADKVHTYLNLPHQVQDLLKTIPLTWDETRYLQGYPGRDVVIARRKGQSWYIAGINGENSFKYVDLNFTELKEDVKDIITFEDGISGTWQIEQCNIESKEKITLEMRELGGFLIVIR